KLQFFDRGWLFVLHLLGRHHFRLRHPHLVYARRWRLHRWGWRWLLLVYGGGLRKHHFRFYQLFCLVLRLHVDAYPPSYRRRHKQCHESNRGNDHSDIGGLGREFSKFISSILLIPPLEHHIEPFILENI